MNLINLDKYFLDQPRFRLSQAKKLIFKDFIEDWSQASVFSLELRNDLITRFPLKIESQLFVAKDNKSGKAVLTLDDGSRIETALMIHPGNRNTVCLSCQVGCPLACKFCASGKSFRRNLTVDEILLQAIFWGRYLKSKKIGNLTNIVFMGSGEPFLNYENVFRSIEYLNNPEYFDISSRKISVSTIGIVDGIRKMSNEKNKVNLAISLHFTDDKTRASIMPGTKKYPLKRLFESIDYYIEKTNRKVMFEYMMIKGINDSIKDAENLAILMKKPLYVVNLIKHNETGVFEPSDNKNIINFKNILKRRGIEVVERFRLNQDVLGACGQLVSK
jgi:23S rRNA (adenine2503-C2)-methyltransferase